MISGSKLILATASTIALAIPAMPAQAAKTTTIYGAGSSLIAPYIRQAGDCYSENLPLIFKGTPPTVQDAPAFHYSGSPPQNCGVDSQDYIQGRAVDYISTGSGTGIKGFFSNDPTQYGDTDPAAGNQYFPTTDYDLSDTSLGAAEVAIYNNGGTNPTVGVTVVAPGQTAGAGQYQNPKEHYGAMIQFPMLVAPVAIVFDPVYKKVRASDGTVKEYTFNLYYLRDGGGLRLDTNAMCQIFNGNITNWNDPALRPLNHGASLKDPSDPDPFDVPLQIVGRQDSSGTTSIFSRYIANVCSGASGNSYVNSHSRLPGTYVDSTGATQTTEIAPGGKDLAGVVYNKANPNNAPSGEQLGVFTLADGNDGVAKYVDFAALPSNTVGDSVVQGRMGYAGPDYALPAVNNTGANDYNLFTADVKNSGNKFVAPTPTAAASAYKSIQAPESDANGNYVPNSTCGTANETGKCRANPQDWVQAADKSVPIANPVGAASYPIVGTTNFLGYTCYAKASNANVVKSFFTFYLNSNTVNDKTLGLLASSGFSPIPSAFFQAIKTSFLNSTSENLYISAPGFSPQCPSSVTGG